MLLTVGLCPLLLRPVTLWPSACLSEESEALFYSLSDGNGSLFHSVIAPLCLHHLYRREKSNDRASTRGLLALCYTINPDSLLYLTLLISLIILAG